MRLRELLSEIVGSTPYSFKWLDEERCVFQSGSVKIGIFAEYQTLTLSNRDFEIVNISFGTIDKKFTSPNNIDTELTNAGEPRTIFSTVAHACIANHQIISSDLLCLAASDQHRKRRSLLYSLALGEIQATTQKFKNRNAFKIETSNGTIISILSNHLFTNEEKEEIQKELKISKII